MSGVCNVCGKIFDYERQVKALTFESVVSSYLILK